MEWRYNCARLSASDRGTSFLISRATEPSRLSKSPKDWVLETGVSCGRGTDMLRLFARRENALLAPKNMGSLEFPKPDAAVHNMLDTVWPDSCSLVSTPCRLRLGDGMLEPKLLVLVAASTDEAILSTSVMRPSTCCWRTWICLVCVSDDIFQPYSLIIVAHTLVMFPRPMQCPNKHISSLVSSSSDTQEVRRHT